jgi:polyketide biosynthesis acyl carrier protein
MQKELVFKVVIQKIAEILPEVSPEQITMQHSLHDIGANSIDRADIIMNTVAEIDVDIPMLEFGGAKNIGDIVELIHRKLNEKS